MKTLADFDFSFQPSVKREQIDGLHTLGFLERKENVVLLRPPGVGKTHLALSLAVAAAQSGRRSTSPPSPTCCTRSKRPGGLFRPRLRTLVFPSLMVIDEIGYLDHPHGGDAVLPTPGSPLRHASTILTSNKGLRGLGRDLQG
ncbi:MAG: ATP-binding protein [Gemmatimonadetes bacterium]|nr:ATP-binding protein [Gemmatimonadota bacterium]